MKINEIAENISHTSKRLRDIEREKKVKPGSDEWFKLWFSLPYLKEAFSSEPDPTGYQHTALTNPQYTIVVNTPGELDWYKLGQHFANLGHEDPHEYGQAESDMMIVAPNKEQLIRYMQELDRLGAEYKLVGGSHEHPEIHAESNVFTNARMNAIKAGKKEFSVNGKTYPITGDIKDELEAETNEARTLQPQTTPLQALVLEYLTFTTTGIMTLVSDGAKSPQAAEELKKVFQTLNQNSKKLQAIVDDKQKLEANKAAILNNIHDMMNYAIAHLKANMIPQEFDAKKKQINSVLIKYNNLASTNENFADGKNPGRKGLAKRMGVNTKASVSSLRKTAKNSTGEKQRMAHWLANMKAGREK